MKKALHLVTTLLCLLTLLVGAATCVQIVQPKQSTCDHCPKQSPLDKHLPACCSAQQQQPSAIASTEVEPQIQLHTVAFIPSLNEIPTVLTLPIARWAATPPLPPLTPLRI
jgi:hypothetical protein